MNTIHEIMGNWLLWIFDIGGHSFFQFLNLFLVWFSCSWQHKHTILYAWVQSSEMGTIVRCVNRIIFFLEIWGDYFLVFSIFWGLLILWFSTILHIQNQKSYLHNLSLNFHISSFDFLSPIRTLLIILGLPRWGGNR